MMSNVRNSEECWAILGILRYAEQFSALMRNPKQCWVILSNAGVILINADQCWKAVRFHFVEKGKKGKNDYWKTNSTKEIQNAFCYYEDCILNIAEHQ